MKFNYLTVTAGFIILLSILVCNAQTPLSAGKPVTAGVGNISLTTRPPANESWTLTVEMSGGFTGSYRNTLRLTSNAQPILDRKEESSWQALSADELTLLSEKIWAAKSIGQYENNANFCLDCVTTTLRIFRTTKDGVTDLKTFSWNLATYSAIPEDIRDIYENIPAIKEAK